MKTITQIVEDKKNNNSQKTMMDNLNHGMFSGSAMNLSGTLQALDQIKSHWDELSGEQQKQYGQLIEGLTKTIQEKGMKVNNLNEIPKSETNVKIDIPGLEQIGMNGVKMESLISLITETREILKNLPDLMKKVTVTVPPIEVPTITVPDIVVPTPKVTINPPAINVPPITVPPQPPAQVTVSLPTDDRPLSIETIRDPKTNILMEIVEIYQNGEINSHREGNKWITNDQRQKAN